MYVVFDACCIFDVYFDLVVDDVTKNIMNYLFKGLILQLEYEF